MRDLAALSFLRGYETAEFWVLGFVICVFLLLLGLMTNAILGRRGFGIIGNGVIVAVGGFGGVYAHDWLLRQPWFTAWQIPQRPLLIGLVAFCAPFLLLLLAWFKRSSA
ncbi:hypothetical protein [Terrarubrum flagellatum]|uniref:hypothetical protein n=1 Tax=Terrirubrum flagellatum TaxID=2895980 RepID=UPI003144DED3